MLKYLKQRVTVNAAHSLMVQHTKQEKQVYDEFVLISLLTPISTSIYVERRNLIK